MFVTETLNARVVARLSGTLPEGGYEEDTPIWTCDAPGLLRSQDAPQPRLSPVSLGEKLAFVIEDLISATEAARFIALTENLGYRSAAPGINTPPGMRRNKTVHWIAPENAMAELLHRMKPYLPATLDRRRISARLSQRINMYRYDIGDEFNPHIDGDWPGFGLSADGQRMEHWTGTHSMLTMLLYLNGAEDGIKGGETVLYDNGEAKAQITPRTGRALFFRHGQNRDSVLHAGATLGQGTSKYVARINIMYDV